METPISGPLPTPRPLIFAQYYQHVVNWCVENRISPTYLTIVDPLLHKLRGYRGGVYILAGPAPFSGIQVDAEEVTALLELYEMRPATEDDLAPLRLRTRAGGR